MKYRTSKNGPFKNQESHKLQRNAAIVRVPCERTRTIYYIMAPTLFVLTRGSFFTLITIVKKIWNPIDKIVLYNIM